MIAAIAHMIFADRKTQFSAMVLEIVSASLILEVQKYLSHTAGFGSLASQEWPILTKKKIHLQG